MPTKTPMYQAMHADRYHRQELIKRIQEQTNRRLLCYVAGSSAQIDRDDIVGFVELLHNVERGDAVDLLLHTTGGDIDAAEKIVTLLHSAVGTAELRVIVPDYAKSAGTLIALGADSVVMSDMSELGPIDPQVPRGDGQGNRLAHSIQTYLDAYDELCEVLRKDPGDVSAQIMLAKLDPATVKLFQAVRKRAQKFAEDQLKAGMFRASQGNYTKIAADLIDTKQWLTHGQMIGWQAATDLGLRVLHLERQSEEWMGYWQLYCQQRLAVRDREKLFESDYASLPMEGAS